MRLISGWPNSSKLFSPGHPWSKAQLAAVAQWTIASQLFTVYGSMQGGSFRGAGDPGGQKTHNY